MTTALTFKKTTFDIVDHNNQPWIRGSQIATALGYASTQRITELFTRHADEFTESMTTVVKLPTEGGEQDVRIFSLRGCHLLAMFARTSVARSFRRWVLDILDNLDRQPQTTVSQPMSELPITPDQQCTLQTLVKSRIEAIPAERRPKGAYPQVWSRFNNHFRLGSYKQLPQARMSEAIEYLMNMVIAQQELPTGDTNTLPQVSGNAFTIPDNTQQAKDFNKILNDVNVLAHKIGQTMLEVGVVANAGGRSSLLPPALNARYNTLDQMHKAAMASLYTAEHMLYCIYYMGKEAQFA